MLLAISVFARRPLAEAIASASSPEPIFWIRDIACVIIASALSCMAVEAWNDGMANVAFMYAWHEFTIIFTIMSVAYLMAFRGGVVMALVSVVCSVIGMAQHYVTEFRGTPITPTDLSMNTLSTAGEVAVGYDLAPDGIILSIASFGIAAMAVSLLVTRPRGDGYFLHVRNMAREIKRAFSGSGNGESGNLKGTFPAVVTDESAPCEPEERHQEVPDGVARDDVKETEETSIAESPSDASADPIPDESLVAISETEDDPRPFGLIVPDGDETVGSPSSKERDRIRSISRQNRHLPRHLRTEASEQGAKGRRLRAVANPVVSLIVTIATVIGVCNLWSFDYKENFPDMITDWWRIGTSYSTQGTIPTFALLSQVSAVKPPSEWTEEKAERELGELVESYEPPEESSPAADAQMPDIIGIMNESYCDMTIYDRLGLPTEATPQFLRSDAPEGIVDSGRMRVSIFGGTTPDSEFEFLTGASMLDFGLSVVPFASYDLTEAPSIVKQLSDLGYGTYAVHPCDKRNWNRVRRYDELGFDEFRSVDEFHAAGLEEQFHGAISDTMCYEMASRILTEREESGEPTFIWDVTMQNHGGYDQGNIPEDQVVQYDLGMLSPTTGSDLREYMSGMENSTRSTLEFLERLEDRPRPTMVVFYGDHQPGATAAMVDELFSDIDFGSRADLQFQTCYFVWENKAMREQRKDENADSDEPSTDASEEPQPDVTSEDGDPSGGISVRPRNEMSANMLGAIMMERIGCPLTDFQKALIALRKESPAMSLMGMIDPETMSWVPMDDDNPPAPLRKLKDIDWLEVDRKIV